MKRSKRFRILILTVSILLLTSWACSDNQAPDIYKEGVLQLKKELENLERIPLEEREIKSNKEYGSYSGIIDYTKRAEYIAKNKKVWDDMFAVFDKAIRSVKLEQWRDDVLFCKALGQLEIASLENSDVFADSAISAMNHFIEFDENSSIELWTKKHLKSVFWDKITGLFSNKISEKKNLNAFFHIGIASLMEHKKGNAIKALEEYEKVIEIDPNGFFAQQAHGQIQLLKERSEGKGVRSPGKDRGPGL